VTPPSTLPGTNVLESPLAVTVKAGLAAPPFSWASITPPSNPTVGSAVTAQITLADVYGNLITAHPGAREDRLSVEGRRLNQG
jgi:hypothetical protein